MVGRTGLEEATLCCLVTWQIMSAHLTKLTTQETAFHSILAAFPQTFIKTMRMPLLGEDSRFQH